jgi:hypothetical protein
MFDRKISSVWTIDAIATDVFGPYVNEFSKDLCENPLKFGNHFLCAVTMLTGYVGDLKVWWQYWKAVAGTEVLIDACKEAGLEANTKTSKICLCLATRLRGRIIA